MKINLDDKVKIYMKEKDETTLTVELETSDSCCIPASLPHVKLGMPKDTHRFDLFEKDGITIYVYKGAVVKNALRIILRNYLLFKDIEVSGIQII